MEKTAVEWLEEQIEKRYGLTPTSILLFRDAKEIEKQQIIDAWTDGKYNYTLGNEENFQDGKQYYNETFNK